MPSGPVSWLLLTQAEEASNLLKPLGGLAAVIQSGIGNVAAGSAFAICQSIGMGGAIPTGVSAVSASLGAFVAGRAAPGGGPENEDPNEAGPDDDDGTGGDADGKADEAGEGPADEGAARTGPNRCPECQRRRVRLCRHPA